MITASWKELYSIEVENLDKIDKISPLKKSCDNIPKLTQELKK